MYAAWDVELSPWGAGASPPPPPPPIMREADAPPAAAKARPPPPPPMPLPTKEKNFIIEGNAITARAITITPITAVERSLPVPMNLNPML